MLDISANCAGAMMQPENATGAGKVRKPNQEVERTVMAMASEMAASKAANDRAYALFVALAASIGVDVANAFKSVN